MADLPPNAVVVPTHICNIQAGDTILHRGELKTLSTSFLKRGGFLGPTIWGDSYRGGLDLVQRVVFVTYTKEPKHG